MGLAGIEVIHSDHDAAWVQKCTRLAERYNLLKTGGSDFIRIVKINPNIDLETLAELGDLVYPGGGLEIVEKVRQVRAGEKLLL